MGQNASGNRSDPRPSIGVMDSNRNREGGPQPSDSISDLPDECLAIVFGFLCPGDRRRCSLVCRRWLTIEGQSHHRLTLDADSGLLSLIPSLFDRYDAVTRLTLACDRRSTSIGDDAFIAISVGCSNLRRLKLVACRELTFQGVETFAKNCKTLKKFSCSQCTFGSEGVNAILNNCGFLEELSVKRLRGLTDESVFDPVGPGIAGNSLRTIFLKELYNGPSFCPLIIGSKNLRTLRLTRCSGDWDKLLHSITNRVIGMVAIHLERIQVSDYGLTAISKCPSLEILHLVKMPYCTNLGLASVAEHCRLLRKLSIDGYRANSIGDHGLLSVATYCHNLQELVLIGVSATSLSLSSIASNCPNLERLALCSTDTVDDAEIACIAAKCVALRKLCIRSCPISDQGIEALACGCPNLVKVKIKRCKSVTRRSIDRFRARRESLVLDLDVGLGHEVQDLTGVADNEL